MWKTFWSPDVNIHIIFNEKENHSKRPRRDAPLRISPIATQLVSVSPRTSLGLPVSTVQRSYCKHSERKNGDAERVAKKINDDEKKRKKDSDDNFEIRVAKPKSRGVNSHAMDEEKQEDAAAGEGEVRRFWKHSW